MAPPYTVFVDDNYHHGDESERYKLGTFASLEEAVAAAKAVVDQSLAAAHTPGMTADELYEAYVNFGEDPFIVPKGPDAASFSAWSYARERCNEICREPRA